MDPENVEEYLRFLANAMDGTSQPFAAIYPDGRIIKFNRAFCELTGYSSAELGRIDWKMGLTPPEWRNHEASMLERMRHDKKPIKYEKEYVRKDGARVPVELYVHMLYSEKSDAVYYFAFINDLSGRKYLEEKLKQANRALKALSKCEAAVICARDEPSLLDSICQIIVETGGYRMAWIGYKVNDGAKTVRPVAQKGYEKGYLEKARVSWADNDLSRSPSGMAIKTGVPYIIRDVLTDPSFTPWRREALRRGYASVIGLPLVSGGNIIGALAIYSDRVDAFDMDEFSLLKELANNLSYGITSLRTRQNRDSAEEALREAKAQVELYLDLMGHDINNMNQVGIGYLELLLGRLGSDGYLGPDSKALIYVPLDALRNSSRLIDKVRKLQRIQAGEVKSEVVDIGRMLSGIKAQYASASKKDVDIIIDFSPDDGYPVMANELLYDVFSNIVGNAIKHSSGQAVINIGLATEYAEGQEYYKVVIEDNGPGIPDSLKGRLFKRFQTGNTETAGTGLGLYLVKTLVETFGGKVWAEDRVRGDSSLGSRFVVMLPKLRDNAVTARSY